MRPLSVDVVELARVMPCSVRLHGYSFRDSEALRHPTRRLSTKSEYHLHQERCCREVAVGCLPQHPPGEYVVNLV